MGSCNFAYNWNLKYLYNMAKKFLIEGVDYTFNEERKMVLTREFHLQRGFCCKSGCKNCPYGFEKEKK